MLRAGGNYNYSIIASLFHSPRAFPKELYVKPNVRALLRARSIVIIFFYAVTFSIRGRGGGGQEIILLIVALATNILITSAAYKQ